MVDSVSFLLDLDKGDLRTLWVTTRREVSQPKIRENFLLAFTFLWSDI
jgi:hypothetical protein